MYHLVTVAAYGVAFALWQLPEWSGIDNWPERIAFMAGAAPLLGWISGVDLGVNFHNHTHRPLLRRAWCNRWLARLWTPVAGWPPLWWTHLHVEVHHEHLLTPRDWTVARRMPAGHHEPSLRYQFGQWPWRTISGFASELRAGHFDRRKAAIDLAWFAVLWSIPFWFDPVMALCLWFVPCCFANIMTLNRGMYVQHAGCHASKVRHEHSNNFLSPYFNRTMFHIGYHGEHHDFPGAHWADLPKLHAAANRSAAKAEASSPTAAL